MFVVWVWNITSVTVKLCVLCVTAMVKDRVCVFQEREYSTCDEDDTEGRTQYHTFTTLVYWVYLSSVVLFMFQVVQEILFFNDNRLVLN